MAPHLPQCAHWDTFPRGGRFWGASVNDPLPSLHIAHGLKSLSSRKTGAGDLPAPVGWNDVRYEMPLLPGPGR